MNFSTLCQVVVAIAALIGVGVSGAWAQLTKISDSVYSYVGVAEGTPGNAFSANAGIVVGETGILVVDTLTSAEEAQLFYRDILKISDKPIKYVVNTHNHLDHALGNSFFADLGAHLISHQKCREAIAASGDQMIKNPEMFGLPQDFWKTTSIVLPEISFTQRMDLDMGGVHVALLHSGMASHSAGSIAVLIAEEDVLFAGDILFTDFHPYVGEGDFAGWATTLDYLISLNISKIIPGHGPLSSNKDFEEMKQYLTFFDENATRLAAEESDAAKLTEQMLAILPQRNGGGFIVGMNIKMRYANGSAEQYGKEK